MPTTAASIRREHVEAFIAAELDRTAPSSATTRYRSLQQLFKWLDDEGEANGSPMAKVRPPIIQKFPSLSLHRCGLRRLPFGPRRDVSARFVIAAEYGAVVCSSLVLIRRIK